MKRFVKSALHGGDQMTMTAGRVGVRVCAGWGAGCGGVRGGGRRRYEEK
jgi:hypothetical protein